MKIVDLTGQRFEKLLVLGLDHINKDKYYLCQCDCGNKKVIRGMSLTKGLAKSCGCLKGKNNLIDLSGQTFGEWFVLGLDYTNNFGSYWKCRCSCGKEKTVAGSSLRYGRSKSCGHIDNLIEKKFGRLLVTNYSHTDDTGHSFWICECDCGNEVTVSRTDLIGGSTISCGCYQREESSKRMSKRILENKNNYKYDWYFLDNNGNKNKCDSSYEVLFWNYYTKILKKDIFYEPETFILKSNLRYTPDFYLPSENLWIELKGSFDRFAGKRQLESIEIFKKNYNHIVLFWKDIVKWCNLPYKSFNVYTKKSQKLRISIEDYLAEMKYVV